MKFSFSIIIILVLISSSIQSKPKEKTSKIIPFSNIFSHIQDDSTTLSREYFLTKSNFAIYLLTRSETEEIFNFISKSQDDKIRIEEWESFARFFIIPFENCLSDKTKYELNFEQFKQCFVHDNYSQFISNRNYKAIFNALSTKSVNSISFFDYFIFKKMLYGWSKCLSTKSYISQIDFKCAISHVVPSIYMHTIDSDMVFETAMTEFIPIKTNHYTNQRRRMDFVSYIRISKITYIFAIVAHSEHETLTSIKKEKFKKSILEGKIIPSIISKNEIDLLYEINNHQESELSFQSFVYFYNLLELYGKYASNEEITKDEMMKLLNDPNFNNRITKAIDGSFTNIEEKVYENVKVEELKEDVNPEEMEHFFSFLQKPKSNKSKNKNKKENKENGKKDEKSIQRENFFNIFLENNRERWTRKIFIKAFYLVRVYALSMKNSLYSNNDTRVSIRKLMKNQNINWKFKFFNKQFTIDLLTYCIIVNINNKMVAISKNMKMLNHYQLLIVLKELGCSKMVKLITQINKKYTIKKVARKIVDLQIRGSQFLQSLAITPKKL